MAKLVTGLFKARSSAMLAFEDLLRHNVPQEDISMQMTDSATGREFFPDVSSKAPEYGVAGAVIGGTIAGLLAALVALGYIPDGGTGLAGLNVPVATLAGVGAGMLIGLLLGLISGALVPEYETIFHAVGANDSMYLLGIYCHPRREMEVRRLLEAAGGTSVRSSLTADQPLHVYGQNRDLVTAAPSGTGTDTIPPSGELPRL